MKIMYLVHQFYPMYYTGTEKFVLSIANIQRLCGHKVKVVTYGFYDRDFYDREFEGLVYKEFVYNCIDVLVFSHKEHIGDIHERLAAPECAEFAKSKLREFSPDLLHVGHAMRVSSFIEAAADLGIPYIMTLTDFWMICSKAVMLDRDNKPCSSSEKGKACASCFNQDSEKAGVISPRYIEAHKILQGAKFIASPSRFLAKMFQQEFESLPIIVVPHGFNYDTIRQNRKKYSAGDKLVFGFCGTLSRHKGIEVLFDAVMKKPNLCLKLKVYGSGGDPLYVKELKSITDSRISFEGVYDERDVGRVFSGIDVSIVPSIWYENYPLVLHESLASRVPVVTTDIGGMAEKIEDGVNGYTFPVGDAEALAEIIEKIVGDPTLLNALKENLHNYLLPTVEQEAWRYSEIYEIC